MKRKLKAYRLAISIDQTGKNKSQMVWSVFEDMEHCLHAACGSPNTCSSLGKPTHFLDSARFLMHKISHGNIVHWNKNGKANSLSILDYINIILCVHKMEYRVEQNEITR